MTTTTPFKSQSRFHFLDEDNRKYHNTHARGGVRQNQTKKVAAPVFDFPELGSVSSGKKNVVSNPNPNSALSFKKAIEYEEEVVVEDKGFQVPEGHVLLTRGENREFVVKYPRVQRSITQTMDDEEDLMDQVVNAVYSNYERHKTSFIEIHGEDEYMRAYHLSPLIVDEEEKESVYDSSSADEYEERV